MGLFRSEHSSQWGGGETDRDTETERSREKWEIQCNKSYHTRTNIKWHFCTILAFVTSVLDLQACTSSDSLCKVFLIFYFSPSLIPPDFWHLSLLPHSQISALSGLIPLRHPTQHCSLCDEPWGCLLDDSLLDSPTWSQTLGVLWTLDVSLWATGKPLKMFQ